MYNILMVYFKHVTIMGSIPEGLNVYSPMAMIRTLVAPRFNSEAAGSGRYRYAFNPGGIACG